MWKWISATAGLLAVATTGGFLYWIEGPAPDLPVIDAPIDVVDRHGDRLGRRMKRHQIPVSRGQISAHLAHAIVSAEDQRFYEHAGVDLRALARATVTNLRALSVVEGGSTITQQLAKMLVGNERTLARKLVELRAALRLERQYDKDEILTMYLNRIYLGRGAYGVAAAAEAWFGKSVSELTPAEASLLAALPQRPVMLQKNPATLERRRLRVVEQMSQPGHDDGAQEPPKTIAEPRQREAGAPFALAAVFRELRSLLPAERIARGGLTVHTTIDLQWSLRAKTLIGETIQQWAERQGVDPDAVDIEGALVAIDPRSGAVSAWQGGRDFERSQFDRISHGCRQPGSAFKPLVFAAALQGGMNPATVLTDAPMRGTYQGKGLFYRPSNLRGSYRGRTTLARALWESRNVPSIEVLQAVGMEQAARFAQTLGIGSPLDPVEGLVLGGSCVRPIELATAYSAIANGGRPAKPHQITSIEDSVGEVLYRRPPSTPGNDPSPISPQVAAMMSALLNQVTLRGTANSVGKELAWPAAGKTGTSDRYDAWYIGWTARLMTLVWVGSDRNEQPLGEGETGARLAVPLWLEFMKTAIGSDEAEALWEPSTLPPGLEWARIDPDTGRRSANGIRLLFRREEIPRGVSDRGALRGGRGSARATLEF